MQAEGDVLSGDLKDAIFAADFGDIISDHAGAPAVYRDPQLFFQNTHGSKRKLTTPIV